MQPTVSSTWAVRGQTPMLRHTAKRMHRASAVGLISVSSGRRRLGVYHLLHAADAIDETLVVATLRAMRRHFRCPLIVLWDRLQAHRSAWVRNYLARTPDLQVEFFPAYAPELNPVEYLWSDSKTHDLAHFCPHTIDELLETAADSLRSKQHDQPRIAGYIRHAKLPLRLRAA